MNTPSKASSLLAQLTLEEKASLCLGSDFWHTAPVERLGIPAIMVSDGPHGLRRQPDEATTSASPAASRPPASRPRPPWRRPGTPSWCAASARRSAARPGRRASRSCSARASTSSAPRCAGATSSTSPRTRSLAGVLGAALVDGVQSQGVGTSLKHFAANNQETDRLRVSADVDERTLREIYLPASSGSSPQARPWTVMCAYNKVNGVYASQHPWLLTEVLRDEWGFDGLVVSDWGAVHDRVAALAAGLDLEMPPNLGVSDAAIVAAVRTGQLDEARARPRRRPGAPAGRPRRRGHRAASGAGPRRPPRPGPRGRGRVRGAAEERGPSAAAAPGRRGHDRGDRRVRPHPALPGRRQLPGQPDPGRRRARRAARCRPGRRGGRLRRRLRHRHHRPRRGAGRRGRRARRPGRRGRRLPRPAGRRRVRGLRPHPHGPAGQPDRAAGPARRRQPAPRRRARQRLGGAARRTGSSTPAVLECWLSGQAAGGAVADLLLGAANPSGRLAETLPLRLEDNPVLPQLPRRGRATSATARASSSATAATTRSTARSATRSGTACPTPASTTPTSPPTSPGATGRRPRRRA